MNHTAARKHDSQMWTAAVAVVEQLRVRFPYLTFRHTKTLSKLSLNAALQGLHPTLGQTQFDDRSSIKPDGGILWVQGPDMEHVILIGEAKVQGTNVKRLRSGLKKQSVGNAIERAHKNVCELRNLMLTEPHFPYALFCHGCDFAVNDITVETPDARTVVLKPTTIPDRLTSLNYGLPVNAAHVRNRFLTVPTTDRLVGPLQAVSLFVRYEAWTLEEMTSRMLDIAQQSLNCLGLLTPGSA